MAAGRASLSVRDQTSTFGAAATALFPAPGQRARVVVYLAFGVALPLTFFGNQIGGLLFSGWAWLLALAMIGPLTVVDPLHPRAVVALWPYLAFLIYALMTLAWTPDLAKGVLTLLQLLLPALAYLVAWQATRDVREVVNPLVKVCFGVLGFVIALVLVDRTVGLGPLELLARPVGISLSIVLTIVTMNSRSWLHTMLIGCVAVAVAVAVGSRMATAVLVLLLLCSPSLALRVHWRVLIVVLLCLLLVEASHTEVFKTRFFFDPNASLLDVLTLSDKVNTAGRRELWPQLLHACSEKATFGHGLGASYGLSTRFSGGPLSHPHNDYLRTFCDVGLTGSIFFWGFFLVMGVRSLGRALKPTPNRRLHGAASMLVLALLIFAVTDNPMVYTAHFMIPLALVLGLSDGSHHRWRIRTLVNE
jgi:O-antigen ligase